MPATLQAWELPAEPHSRGLWAPLVSGREDSASRGPVRDMFLGARLGPSALRGPHLKPELGLAAEPRSQPQVRIPQCERNLAAPASFSP